MKAFFGNQRQRVLAGLAFFMIFLAAVCIAGFLLGDAAVATDFSRKNLAPCMEYPFGTDWLGRDMFARTLKGLSVSILLGVLSAAVSAVLALILGVVAATLGRVADAVISFCIDWVMGVPHILLLILISVALGKGFHGVAVGVALTHWPSLARVIRAEVLQLKESAYIQIAKRLGKGKWYIVRKHMLPHLAPQFFVGLVLLFPHAILHESSVTFLGFGLSSEQPAIGNILSEAMRYLVTGQWWLAVFPGALLAVTVALFYAAGESLRKFTDPGSIHQAGGVRNEKCIGAKETERTGEEKVVGEEKTAEEDKAAGEDKTAGAEEPLLKIEGLQISFTRYESGLRPRTLQTVRRMNLDVRAGEMVAVVGASGSGKSLLAHAVMGLLPYNASMSGSIAYQGETLTGERLDSLRGNEIVLVPQSLSYLDPLMKTGRQICKSRKSGERQRKLREIFHRYHLEEAVENLYPFELSGGMKRRILISTAMIEEPKLVIADEPTPGLDLKTAKRAMGHFRELADMGAGVLLITHDLRLAVETADRIVVFYDGETVDEVRPEDFRSEETLTHPYTKALWRAMPGRAL